MKIRMDHGLPIATFPVRYKRKQLVLNNVLLAKVGIVYEMKDSK